MDIPAPLDAVNLCMTDIARELTAIKPDAVDTVYIVNGCLGERILTELVGTYCVQILDCCGHEIAHFEKTFAGIESIALPAGGLAVMKKA